MKLGFPSETTAEPGQHWRRGDGFEVILDSFIAFTFGGPKWNAHGCQLGNGLNTPVVIWLNSDWELVSK